MNVYFAGTSSGDIKSHRERLCKNLNILESFYYVDDGLTQLIPYFSNFLLDSGAFTFFSSKTATGLCWDEYLERYADYIVKNNIRHFMELDIDSIVGYDEVLRFRKKLERLTDRPCIPVWHKTRGREDYIKTCQQYDYVAIGGIVSKEIKRNEYPVFTHLIDIAHKNKAKVHGLGFTDLQGLPKYHFDSVDSTAWTSGTRFGVLYTFDGKTLKKIKKTAEGKRVKEPQKIAFHNFAEWVKFAQYAETHY